MMKDLNNYREISNKELQESRVVLVQVLVSLYLWQLIPLGKISVKSLVSHAR